ncbi:transposase, partial [Rhizobium favelukesii]|uniref:transposase n=1 Tax=Rhizobium favelukesii TaxID=348824 RepID=UPI0035A6E429
VSDDHAGLVAAIAEALPEAAWQRCYVGLLKNRMLAAVMRRPPAIQMQRLFLLAGDLELS